MEQDFLKELELLGVTARLKRLSDALTASIKELYRARDVDLEPSWHLVLRFLEHRTATLTEVSEALRLSQPAMTKMVERMIARGYLDVLRDPADSRKKVLRLSRRARRLLPAFERVWAAGQAAIGDLLGADPEFFRHLEAFETKLERKSFQARALEHLGPG